MTAHDSVPSISTVPMYIGTRERLAYSAPSISTATVTA